MKTFLFCVLVLCAQLVDAQSVTINVADHGVVPGKDATFPLYQLLQSVKDQTDVTLVFPAGQYDFHPANAFEQFRAVSNHDNSLKRIVFPLFDFKNISIDGGGSTFLFHGRVTPFTLDGVQGAVLKNFSIDWDRSFHNELTVVESNEAEKSFVVEVDPELYPYKIQESELKFQFAGWEDETGSNIVFDPATRAPIYDTHSFGLPWTKLTATPAGRDRIKISGKVNRPPPVGSVLITYGVNPTSRLCPAIHLANSSNIHVENVTVYDAGGMALIAERCENVDLDHFVVTSGKGRLVSTRADATHFVGCKGTIRLENCLLEHMLDDGINVHGAYVRVDESLGDGKFICAISHPQQWGLTFAQPGDSVALLSRETILPFHETTVKNVTILNEERFLIELEGVPKTLPDVPLSIENLTWYPDVVMKKNIIRENRARSALITTKGKVMIEDNYFSSQMHGILIEGDNNKWYESGAVQDVTIQNNVFENIGFQGGPTYPLLASPLLTPAQRLGEGQYHRNINFLNNTVKSFNGLIAQARSVSGLNIVGNTIELSSDYPANSEFPSIDLDYCDGVTINGNQSRGFGRPLFIASSADTTKVDAEGNEGLETK